MSGSLADDGAPVAANAPGPALEELLRSSLHFTARTPSQNRPDALSTTVRNPSVSDVHAAVRWALAHDLPALLAYRQDTHLARGSRWKADAAFVAHWQQTVGAGRPVGAGSPLPSSC
jgi:hypothetical protein